MRKSLALALSVAVLATVPFAAQAQDRRGGGRGYDDADTATAAQVAAADRRLNQIYQRRIADARQNDRTDRRVRGWYSQEQSLRESERLWINFRDAECRYLTQQDLGRRDRDARARGCMLNRIEERADQLRNAEVMLSQR